MSSEIENNLSDVSRLQEPDRSSPSRSASRHESKGDYRHRSRSPAHDSRRSSKRERSPEYSSRRYKSSHHRDRSRSPRSDRHRDDRDSYRSSKSKSSSHYYDREKRSEDDIRDEDRYRDSKSSRERHSDGHRRREHGSSRHSRKDEDRDSRRSRERDRRESSHRSSRRDHDRDRRRRRRRSHSSSSSTSSGSSSSSSESRNLTREQKLLLKQLDDSLTSLQRSTATEFSRKCLSLFGYSADQNPFHDPDILRPFVWRHKYALEITKGERTSVPTAEELERDRLSLMDEIVAARERKIVRDRERAEKANTALSANSTSSHLQDSTLARDWGQLEDEFARKQLRIKVLMRLRSGRLQLVDRIALNPVILQTFQFNRKELDPAASKALFLASPAAALREAASASSSVGTAAAKKLQQDLEDFLHGDLLGDTSKEYWRTALSVLADEIARARLLRTGSTSERVLLQRLEEFFGDQTLPQLQSLQTAISNPGKASDDVDVKMLTSLTGNSHSDHAFLERVNQFLGAAVRRAQLQRLHELLLLDRLAGIIEEFLPFSTVSSSTDVVASDGVHQFLRHPFDPDSAESRANEVSRRVEILHKHGILSDAEIKQFSSTSGISTPSTTSETEMDLGVEIDEYGSMLPTGDTYTTMDGSLEVNVNSDSVDSSKFKLRKPKFVNKVRTGYNWNQYNKSHYTYDNPPPKTVQGYKFNIMYPDLLDKSKSPKFYLEPADSPEFAILRFSAGPPYEDIAFKIVNQEWITGQKNGYKCIFEHGVLQLHFNFKKQRYRK